jgi:serine/threonine-protein kinase RsbT
MTEESSFQQEFKVEGGDFSRGGEVSCEVKNLLRDLGVPPLVVRRASIACYEAEMNVIMYALQGTLSLTVTPGRIRIVVEDRGPGIPDVKKAMQEGYSTATPEMRELGFGAGMGLSNIKKNTDTLRISSKVGRGTRLDMMLRTNGHKP